MKTIKRKDKYVRMWYSTFQKIRREFPPLKDESMSRYFERLAIMLEEENWDIKQD